MSKLDDLLKEFCPNGVIFQKISDVCQTITDYTAAGSFADVAKNVKYIVNSTGYAQLIRTTDLKSKFSSPDKFIYVDEHAYKYLWRVNLDSEGLVLPNVGNCGEVYYVDVNTFPNKYNVLGPNAIWLKSDSVNTRYLYHVLLSKDFQNKLSKIISPTGQTKFNKTNFKSLTIPVPPLEVQREIVRILDNFTELTEELTEELTARKKQYEYYRDVLLNKNILECKKQKLSEIAEVYDGTHQTPDYKTEGVPFISVENIANIYGSQKYISCEDYAKYKIKPKIGDLFMTRIGSIGKCAVFDKEADLAYYVSLALIRPKQDVVTARYLKHYIESIAGTKELARRTLHNAVPIKINKDDIGKILVSYPSLEVQNKICDTLDNFEKICNDLNIGLPAEIEAPQKQYEFYRDQLLTFAETGETIFTDRQS